MAVTRMSSLPADCDSLGGLLFSAGPALPVNLAETRSSYQFHATCQGHRPPQCSTSEQVWGLGDKYQSLFVHCIICASCVNHLDTVPLLNLWNGLSHILICVYGWLCFIQGTFFEPSILRSPSASFLSLERSRVPKRRKLQNSLWP